MKTDIQEDYGRNVNGRGSGRTTNAIERTIEVADNYKWSYYYIKDARFIPEVVLSKYNFKRVNAHELRNDNLRVSISKLPQEGYEWDWDSYTCRGMSQDINFVLDHFLIEDYAKRRLDSIKKSVYDKMFKMRAFYFGSENPYVSAVNHVVRRHYFWDKSSYSLLQKEIKDYSSHIAHLIYITSSEYRQSLLGEIHDD